MPFSWIYGGIMNFRNALFGRGVLREYDLGAPTISVGNITVGGTGKTPHVALIAGIISEQTEKVCILTRGYGRKDPKTRVLVSDGEEILASPETGGDEPFELATKLLGKAIIIADADRVSAAEWALQQFKISAFVLDDGFQHRRAKRDLDIVLIDATDPFSNRLTLPFGRLREPLSNLSRVDLIIISRTNLVGADHVASIRAEISKYNSECPVLDSSNKFSSIRQLDDYQESENITTVKENRFLAFCALGNPENFFEQLRREGFEMSDSVTFQDHHNFTQTDCDRITSAAAASNATALITTAKDAVKLRRLEFRLPCFVAENSVIIDDEKGLRKLIYAALNN